MTTAFEPAARALIDDILTTLPLAASQASLVRQRLLEPDGDWVHEADVMIGLLDSLTEIADALDYLIVIWYDDDPALKQADGG